MLSMLRDGFILTGTVIMVLGAAVVIGTLVDVVLL